jgi:hypothetical protein
VRWAGCRWSWIIPAFLLGSATLVVGAAPLLVAAGNSKPPHEVTASLIGPRRGALPIGSVVSFKYLSDLSFVSNSQGYALAIERSVRLQSDVVYAAVTTDGGRIWRIDGPPLHIIGIAQAPAAVDLIGSGAPSVAFAYQGGQLIDSTSDSGQHWWSAVFANELAAAAVGNDIWTLVNGFSSSLQAAPVWLYTSTDGGRHWFYKSTLPNLSGGFAELIRPTPTTSYALVEQSGHPIGYNPISGIVVTTDGGAQWTARPDPCNLKAAPRIFNDQLLGATSTNDLWLACGGAVRFSKEVGEQVKEIFMSTDGGLNWRSVAATAGLASSPKKANLPLAGVLGETGATHQAAFTSQGLWVVLSFLGAGVRTPGLTFRPSVLLHSVDAGKVWSNVPKEIADQDPQQVTTGGSEALVETVEGLWSRSAHGRWTLLAGSRSPA